MIGRLLGIPVVLTVLLAGILLSPSSNAFASSGPAVEVEVRPERVDAGEPVTLHIGIHGKATGLSPDLTPLEASFEILDVRQSQSQTWINGRFDARRDWQVTLLPKGPGTIGIPPLEIGTMKTRPLTVEVSAVPAAPRPLASNASPGNTGRSKPDAHPTGGDVFVEVTTDEADPYEQQRVLLHVRLYAGRDVLEGTLDEPVIDGATVERLGDDRRFEEEIDGRPYQGIERIYTVLPESPGRLVVPAITFEGRVRDTRRTPPRRRFDSFFGRSLIDEFFSDSMLMEEDLFDSLRHRGTRRIAARSTPLNLDVRPRPPASRGQWWLPADRVTLEEEWTGDTERVRVGEALTRRITLRADGASAVQLPPLTLPEVHGAKQYAEASTTEENVRGSVRIQEATLIPTEAGSLTLPAIEVSWWDVKADLPRTARLPAQTITVLPALGGKTPGPGSQTAPAPQSGNATPDRVPEGDPMPIRIDPTSPWWIGSALALLLMVGGGIGWFLRSHSSRDAGTPPRTPARAARRALRRACRRSDPVAAEQALRDLARAETSADRPPNLAEWARQQGGEDLRREVMRLQGAQYSRNRVEWDGRPLWEAFKASRKRNRHEEEPPVGMGLPPLYPDGGIGDDARGVT